MAKTEKIVNQSIKNLTDTVVEGPIPEPVKVEIKKYNFTLVVRNPFLTYNKGDRISNDKDIHKIKCAGKIHHCCKVSL